MRLVFAVVLLMSLNVNAFGAIGKVSKISGKGEAYLLRNKNKVLLTKNIPLELDDKIVSDTTSITIELESKTQVALGAQSEIAIVNGDKEVPLINFFKGMIRVKAQPKGKDLVQKVQAEGVSFTGKKTEFEVSDTEESIDLDVIKGEVTVSSPFVQTFVPEVVKAKEGFSFGKSKKGFSRRPFQSKFK